MCTYQDCDRQNFTGGLCKAHYQQKIKGKALTPLTKRTNPVGGRPECAHPTCTRLVDNKDHCQTHHFQILSGKPLKDIPAKKECEFPDCGKPKKSRTHCAGHHAQTKAGKELTPLRSKTAQPFYCTVDACSSESHAKGLCRKHYSRKS